MASVWLAYRLQVFKPRSVDSTESALLVPIGAAHSDNFDVATIAGVAGVQPYLMLPDGQNGSIDPVSKNTTIGTRVLSIGDIRVTPGGSNAVRWATAFMGDATGRNRLKGCKAILFEQTTQGGAWNPIFTGRIGNVRLDGLLKIVLEVKSSADDLKRKIFMFDPLVAATYAFRTALFPPRLPKSWGGGTLPGGKWIKGSISNPQTTAGITTAVLAIDQQNQDEDIQALTMVTKQSYPFAQHSADALVHVNVTIGGATGAFLLPAINNESVWVPVPGLNGVQRRVFLTDFRYLQELPLTHPLHLTMPADGTAVTFYISGDGNAPVSESNPLFIDDVDPLKLWADILDGYFSLPNSDYSARKIAPRDTSAAGPWDYTNAASPSFSMSDLPKVRFIIKESARANDWIQANILQPFNLGYRVDGQGRVVPLDERTSAGTVVSGAIVDSDLAELPTDWGVDGASALLGAEVKYYVDIPKPAEQLLNSSDPFPDIGASLLDTVESTLLVTNPNLDPTRDAGDTITRVDAQGLRLTEQEVGLNAGDFIRLDKAAKVKSAMYDLLAPFAGGSVTIPLAFRRSTVVGSFAKDGQPGQFWTITSSPIPDPATNQRGGARVGLCLSRHERGLRVLATFLDVGSATLAAAPAIGALAISNGGLNIPITVNAASDPVQVEYIVTPAGTATRPIATDPSWKLVGAPLTANGTARFSGAPANTRLWVRARSRPAGIGLKLPSAYVFPAAGAPAGSIDVAAITVPSAVVVSAISGNRATVAWTNGDATQSVELYLTTGGVPGTWTDAMRVQPTLPAGSTSVQLRSLTPSTNYAIAVRHRDVNGGTSSLATATFATTATPSTAPLTPPLGIGGGGGGTTSGTGIDVAPILVSSRRGTPAGITLLLNPGDPAFGFEIQRAPDSSGAPNVGAAVTIAKNLLGTRRVWHDKRPLDGATHWYRVRHVGFGDTPGLWSDWSSATATMQRHDAPSIATLVRNLDGEGNGQRQLKIRGQGRSIVQTLTYEIPNAEFDIWESSSQPHAWTVDTGDSSSSSQDLATVFSGDSSAKFSFGAGGAAGTFRGLTTNDQTKGAFCIPLHPGTKYRFKFVSRVSSIANAPSYRVTLTHDVGGTLVTQQTFAYRAANKWQIDLLTFEVPLGAGPLTRLAIEYSRNATTALDFWQDGTRLVEIGTRRCVILTAGTTWTVPGDFNPANNTVELWGGGGGGAPGTLNANGGGGGGGGGYRYQKNFDPGAAATVAYAIGGGGGASAAGGDTTWNAAAVTAKGGSGAAVAGAGAGGAIGSGGTGGNSGGTGGAGRAGTGNSGGGGGGGAAGSVSANNGAAGTNVAAGAGGQGGTGVQSNASAVGGTGGVATGGAGGNASQLTSTDDATAAGAGGGGGGAFNPTSGGNGGQYGAGGGGGGATAAAAGSGSSGKQGCIVISWVTAA